MDAITVGTMTAKGFYFSNDILDPPDFVEEMCAWLSFWKQNTFHLHLSDNLWVPDDCLPRQT